MYYFPTFGKLVGLTPLLDYCSSFFSFLVWPLLCPLCRHHLVPPLVPATVGRLTTSRRAGEPRGCSLRHNPPLLLQRAQPAQLHLLQQGTKFSVSSTRYISIFQSAPTSSSSPSSASSRCPVVSHTSLKTWAFDRVKSCARWQSD